MFFFLGPGKTKLGFQVQNLSESQVLAGHTVVLGTTLLFSGLIVARYTFDRIVSYL